MFTSLAFTLLLAVLWTLLSFSLDMSGLLSTAEDMFNALAPIILTIAGIGLGIGILAVVGKAIKNAI